MRKINVRNYCLSSFYSWVLKIFILLNYRVIDFFQLFIHLLAIIWINTTFQRFSFPLLNFKLLWCEYDLICQFFWLYLWQSFDWFLVYVHIGDFGLLSGKLFNLRPLRFIVRLNYMIFLRYLFLKHCYLLLWIVHFALWTFSCFFKRVYFSSQHADFLKKSLFLFFIIKEVLFYSSICSLI